MSYELINWENSPSTKTPINAENLKHMDEGIAQAHEMADELETYKANSIIQTSTGQTIYETDCAAVSPVNIKLFGKGKQDTRVLKLLGRTVSSDTNYSNTSQRTFDGNTIFVGISSDNYLSSDNISSYAINENSVTTNAVNAGYGIGFDVEVYEGEEYLLGYDVNNDSFAGMTFYDKDGNYISYVVNIKDTNVVVPSGARWMVVVFRLTLGSTATYTNINLTLVNDTIPSMKHKREVEFLGESGSIVGKVLTGNLFDDVTYFESQGFTQNEDYWEGTGARRLLYTNYKGIKGSLVIEYDYMSLASVNVFIMEIHYTDGTQDLIGQWKQNEWVHNKITTDATKTVDYIYRTFVDSGTFYVKNFMISTNGTSYESYTEQPFTALTPNGLRGTPLGQTIPDAIANSPIHMSGVYWDETEQQYYIGDTKNEDGKDVQRIITEVLDKTHFDGSVSDLGTVLRIGFTLNNTALSKCNTLCTQLRCDYSYAGDYEHFYIITSTSIVAFINKAHLVSADASGVRSFLAENPLTLYYILAEPIVTETDTQYDVAMNYPNTTIVNDAGAYMEVTHVKDTQKHIEQNYVSKAMHEEHESRIAELEKAIVNS